MFNVQCSMFNEQFVMSNAQGARLKCNEQFAEITLNDPFKLSSPRKRGSGVNKIENIWD